MLPELNQKQHDLREQTGNEKLCFDCAGTNGSRVEPSRKAQKTHLKTLDVAVSGDVGFRIVFGTSLDVFWDIVTYFGRLGWPSWPSLDSRDLRNTPLVPKPMVADYC